MCSSCEKNHDPQETCDLADWLKAHGIEDIDAMEDAR